jgi:DNA-binding NtrC family response regulator
VSLLAGHFLRKFSGRFKKTLRGITSAALSVLEAYPWPGNVRELENLIERLVVLSTPGQLIDERDLPFDLLIKEDEPERGALTLANGDIGLLEARQTFERQYIQRALQQCMGNQTDTARLLKIHRNTLLQKMKQLNLRYQEEP